MTEEVFCEIRKRLRRKAIELLKEERNYFSNVLLECAIKKEIRYILDGIEYDFIKVSVNGLSFPINSNNIVCYMTNIDENNKFKIELDFVYGWTDEIVELMNLTYTIGTIFKVEYEGIEFDANVLATNSENCPFRGTIFTLYIDEI